MHKIQEIFNLSYNEYCKHFNPTIEQNKAAFSIMSCKSGKLGCNISICDDCGHFETHNNSCRNRHCPCCQAILKELWIDKRKSEVIRGKFLARLQEAYAANKLTFSSSCKELRNSYNWNEFRDSLYTKQWIPFIKETFNGFGNAIDYLGRYTHRIAISNSRIKTVTNTHVTFTAKDYRTNDTNDITITHVEFIRRFLMHVLP
ncbi:MAG: transposase, partial [Lachnotalea sp.]